METARSQNIEPRAYPPPCSCSHRRTRLSTGESLQTHLGPRPPFSWVVHPKQVWQRLPECGGLGLYQSPPIPERRTHVSLLLAATGCGLLGLGLEALLGRAITPTPDEHLRAEKLERHNASHAQRYVSLEACADCAHEVRHQTHEISAKCAICLNQAATRLRTRTLVRTLSADIVIPTPSRPHLTIPIVRETSNKISTISLDENGLPIGFASNPTHPGDCP